MNEQQGLFIGIPFWVITLINYCVCDPNALLDNQNLLYFYELLSTIPCNFTFFVYTMKAYAKFRGSPWTFLT